LILQLQLLQLLKSWLQMTTAFNRASALTASTFLLTTPLMSTPALRTAMMIRFAPGSRFHQLKVFANFFTTAQPLMFPAVPHV
jgi:hypothetical protein